MRERRVEGTWLLLLWRKERRTYGRGEGSHGEGREDDEVFLLWCLYEGVKRGEGAQLLVMHEEVNGGEVMVVNCCMGACT
jgi:hypothetical protein